MLTDIHNYGKEGGCSWGSKRELLHRAEDMNKISKKDGTYVLDDNMDGNVMGLHVEWREYG